MPRGKRPDLALRNAQIYEEWVRKPDLPALAQKYGLTPQRIGQLVADFHPDLETEHERALLKGGLWNLVREIQEVIEQPGYKLAPNGHLATDDDGDPVPDTMARIEAIKVKGTAYKQLAQLVGAEKVVPRQLQVTLDVAQQEKNAAIEAKRRELEELAKRAEAGRVISGKVVRELTPVQQRGEEGLWWRPSPL